MPRFARVATFGSRHKAAPTVKKDGGSTPPVVVRSASPGALLSNRNCLPEVIRRSHSARFVPLQFC